MSIPVRRESASAAAFTLAAFESSLSARAYNRAVQEICGAGCRGGEGFLSVTPQTYYFSRTLVKLILLAVK